MKSISFCTGMFLLVASLQGCGGGSSALTDGSQSSTPPVVSAPTGGATDDTPPTITYSGFAVVQDKGTYSAKVVTFFSEDMDPASINSKTILVADAHGKSIPGDVIYIGVTAVFTPTESFDAETRYSAEVTTGVRSLAGVAMAKDHNWKFTTPSPSDLTGVLVTVASNSPAAYEMDVPLNTAVNVTFGQVMDPATINPTTFTVIDAGGTKMPGRVHYTGITATFVPDAPFAPQTTYRAIVSAKATSLSGISMDGDYRWVFTTGNNLGTTAPQMVLSEPLAGDTDVDLDSSVAAYFNESMDTNSINTSSFMLVGPEGEQIGGHVTYAGNAAVFTPDQPLQPETVYTATVSASAASSGGIQLGHDYQWSFTTGVFAAAPIAPTVLFSDPAPYATGIARNADIDIAFSGMLDPTTVTAANITLTAQDGSAVAGSVAYQGSVAIFVPTAPLAMGANYTVTVGRGIKSLDGIALEAPVSWSFTTAGGL